MENLELRSEIEKITEGEAATLREQVEKIAALKSQYPHSIKHLGYRNVDPMLNYNCFMHALGTIGSEIIIKHLKWDAERECKYGILFGSNIVLRLIKKGILNRCEEGEVIMYFSDNNPVHGGRIKDDRVTSKWGSDCLWEHTVWEVPARYGNRTERFLIPKRGQVESEFDDYAKELVAIKQ